MIARGIYHTHSTYSHDGTFTLPELKKLLMDRGYQFAIMTEHAEDLNPGSYQLFYEECIRLSDASFLFIPGLEVPYEGKVHVGCFPSAAQYDVVPLYREGISAMRDRGATTIYHHPSKQQYYMNDDFRSLLDGVEVWNSRYEGNVIPSKKTVAFVNTFFKREGLLMGGLDLHTKSQWGGPTLIISVDALTVENIHTMIKNGAYEISGRFFTYGRKNLFGLRSCAYWLLRTLYDAIKRLRDRVWQ